MSLTSSRPTLPKPSKQRSNCMFAHSSSRSHTLIHTPSYKQYIAARSNTLREISAFVTQHLYRKRTIGFRPAQKLLHLDILIYRVRYCRRRRTEDQRRNAHLARARRSIRAVPRGKVADRQADLRERGLGALHQATVARRHPGRMEILHLKHFVGITGEGDAQIVHLDIFDAAQRVAERRQYTLARLAAHQSPIDANAAAVRHDRCARVGG